MKKVFQIFIRDLKRLSGNMVAMIVVAGVCLIPSLYAWFNIAANMDPYSNTKGILIAVADNDAGTDNELTGRLNAGEEIIKNLKENETIGWTFVSEKEAVSGVQSGKYYAAIVIPKDFSESLVSVLSGKIEQPKIDYYLNEKKNAIAPKVTDTGASTIQTEVNSTFVSVASETITEILNSSIKEMAGDMEQTHNNLDTSLRKVSELVDGYEDIWKDFKNTYKDSKKLIADTRSILDSVERTVRSGAQAVEGSKSTLADGRKEVSQFAVNANSYLSGAEDVLSDIRTQTGNDIGKLNEKVQGTTGKINDLISALETVVSENKKIIDDLTELNKAFPEGKITDLLTQLKEKNTQYETFLKRLKAQNDSMADTSSAINTFSGNLNTILDTNKKTFYNVRHSFEGNTLPGLNLTLDSVSQISGNMSGVLLGIETSCEQLKTVLNELQSGLNDTNEALRSMDTTLKQISSQIKQVGTDWNTLISSHTFEELQKMAGVKPEDVADFMLSPIKLKTESFYPMKNYGSAMTPFYTNLAIWVGGIVLIAIFKLEVDCDEKIKNFSTTESYFGRWMLFVVTGLVQALIICLGDIYILKLQCLSPTAFIGAGLLASFVYVNLIYALSLTFKHIGKALCVLLVILQIPGSAGTYPIEMTPGFFQKIHPLLPFTYGINAQREAIAGMYENIYWKYLGCLAAFLFIALFVGLCVRPLLVNLNSMFDKKLAETDLMIGEENGMSKERFHLMNILKILASEKEYKEVMISKAEKFEARYKRRVRAGFLLLIILPLVFLVLMFSIDSKMVFLILWIASIIMIALYLICLEYIHEKLKERQKLFKLSQEDLLKSIQKETVDKEGVRS